MTEGIGLLLGRAMGTLESAVAARYQVSGIVKLNCLEAGIRGRRVSLRTRSNSCPFLPRTNQLRALRGAAPCLETGQPFESAEKPER